MKKFRILYFLIILLSACEKLEPMGPDQVSFRQAQNLPPIFEPYSYNNCGLKVGQSSSANQILNDSWSFRSKLMGVSETFVFESKDGKKQLSFSFPYVFKENSKYFTYSHYNLGQNSWNQVENPGGVQITGTIELAGQSYKIFLSGSELFVRHSGNQHFIEMCNGNCMYKLNGMEANSDISINLMWEEKR